MLDNDERAAAVAASDAFRDVPQFWDGAQALGKEVGRSVGSPEWTAWDIYLFYPPGARWDDHLPPPAAALAQTSGVVVGTKGTLPPAADQSALSQNLRTRLDVVGVQADLETLLAKVAAEFAGRTRATVDAR